MTETRTRRTDEDWRPIILEYEQWSDHLKDFFAKHGVYRGMVERARKNLGCKYQRGDARNLAILRGEVAAKTPTGGRKYSPEIRARAIELFKQGRRIHQIAAELNLSAKKATVSYWINAFKKTNGTKGELIPAANVVPVTSSSDLHAAITLLRRMDKEITRLIRQNKIERADNAHLLGQLALRALTGD